MDTKNKTEEGLDLDSPINTGQPNAQDGKSLTNDESASLDPEQTKTKPSFTEDSATDGHDNANERFDGTINI